MCSERRLIERKICEGRRKTKKIRINNHRKGSDKRKSGKVGKLRFLVSLLPKLVAKEAIMSVFGNFILIIFLFRAFTTHQI